MTKQMWKNLPENERNEYRKLVTNFASLSEAFAQKFNGNTRELTPIINSKFQEVAFQRSFNATAEDINNSSYDASISFKDDRKVLHRYLVGIKSFGLNSEYQKIAQFKGNSGDWSEKIDQIAKNAKNVTNKNTIKSRNLNLYLELAENISKLRNERIRSSKEQLKGFKNNATVEAYYHVLMTNNEDNQPKIYVGETIYNEIDEDKIKILGCTTSKKPTNFDFTDGIHNYRYTSADSQLYMSFKNNTITVDTWNVRYVADAFSFFENINGNEKNIVLEEQPESYSWMILNKNGEVKPYSGYNAFNGGSKLAKKNQAREKAIEKFIDNHQTNINANVLKKIIGLLQTILLQDWSTKDKKAEMIKLRSKLMILVDDLNQIDISQEIEQMVFRPAKEMYIPIPEAREFNEKHPNFFGQGIGKLNEHKLLSDANDRMFTLRFLPSGNEIMAHICQADGKAIQSVKNQGILGDWILRHVFQLGPREPLTMDKLRDLEINAIRLTKARDGAVELEFIWINPENPPADARGWVAKND